jgi:muconolactone D-isomerase
MLFMLKIDYTQPAHYTAQQAEELRREEDAHAGALAEQGTLVRIWRVVGAPSNFSLWRADTLEALHAQLSRLPMFPFLKIQATPLIEHPLAHRCLPTLEDRL